MVTITLPSELEKAVTEEAAQKGTTVELPTLDALQERFLKPPSARELPEGATLADSLVDYIGAIDTRAAMQNASNPVRVARQTLIEFCKEFVARPLLCYTEHGLHALFFSRLYNALPAACRYADCNNHNLCVIQKEYPTAQKLGYSRRQHWDISLVKTPVIPPTRPNAYDYLPLAAVVEFALNRGSEHLERDIKRLCDPGANVDHGFVVHLYRLSYGTEKVSGRDLAANSRILCSKNSVRVILGNRPVEVLYGVVDANGANPPALWLITSGGMEQLA